MRAIEIDKITKRYEALCELARNADDEATLLKTVRGMVEGVVADQPLAG